MTDPVVFPSHLISLHLPSSHLPLSCLCLIPGTLDGKGGYGRKRGPSCAPWVVFPCCNVPGDLWCPGPWLHLTLGVSSRPDVSHLRICECTFGCSSSIQIPSPSTIWGFALIRDVCISLNLIRGSFRHIIILGITSSLNFGSAKF